MYPLPQRQKNKARDIATISKDLATLQPPSPMTNSHFLNCRYDPFSPTPIKSYIPDGKGKNVVVRDIKLAHDIVVASGEIMNINIYPWLPFPIGFATNDYMVNPAGSASTVDGKALGGVSTGGPSAVAASYLRAVFPNPLRSTLNVPSLPLEAGNVVGSRIITIGYRLYYTGPASSAQGVISVYDVGWSYESRISANTNALNQFVALNPAVPATFDAAPANTSPLTVVSISANNTALVATNQVLVRPENGLKGVLKYQQPADAHAFQPWDENGMMLGIQATTASNTEILCTTRNGTAFPSGAIAEYNLVDPALMGALIRITGSGSYRLEVAVCYEQDLSIGNAMIDMARQSPMVDRVILDIDDKLNSTVHPAPLNSAIIDLASAVRGMNMGRPTRSNQANTRNRRKRRRNRKKNTTPCSRKGKGKAK